MLFRRSAAHFNPRSPHGERLKSGNACKNRRNFNPRSPHGERPAWLQRTQPPPNFNPRSPHGERLPAFSRAFRSSFPPFQPTLPARGATGRNQAAKRREGGISTHAPRTGSDTTKKPSPTWSRFQPTLPARGATGYTQELNKIRQISTHAPRTGSDAPIAASCGSRPHFNPRSPHGERLLLDLVLW